MSLVSTIPALAAADTARRTTLAVGRIVGATTSVAMLLLVRQGRPRSALDAALAGIAVQVVQWIAVWVLEGDPQEAARQGRFTMRLTMHSLIAAAPAGGD